MPDANVAYKGECFEVDKETKGQRYSQMVSPDRCRPRGKTNIGYLWLQKADDADGECLLIDKRNPKSSYSKSVPYKKCQPEKVEKILLEGKCYLKGETLDGSTFHKKVDKRKCKSDDLSYVFELDESGLRGKCFSLDPSNGGKFPESITKCKPDNTQYIPIDKKNYTDCYEVSINGPQEYIKKANRKKCAPSDLRFEWIQTKEFSGECIKTDGSFKEPTDSKNCLDFYKLDHVFYKVSEYDGKCLKVDKETSGGRIRLETSMQYCKPKELTFKLVYIEDRGTSCLSFDPYDLQNGYRKVVSSSNCEEKISEVVWVSNSSDPLRGKCVQQFKVGDKLNTKALAPSKCKPKKTKFIFVNSISEDRPLSGKCYEVPLDGDHSEYSKSVGSEKCKPDIVEIRYFHPDQFGIDGGCYEVDKSTGGKKYHYRVANRKCKRMLDFPLKKSVSP